MSSLASPFHDEHGRPIQTAPPPPSPGINTAATTERRRQAGRKAAETVRAKRRKEEIDQAVEASLDRVATAVAKEAVARANDPPGTPTARDLIRIAQAEDAEAELYRLAHKARLPWKPSQWSAEARIRLGEALTDHLRNRKAPRTKGPAK